MEFPKTYAAAKRHKGAEWSLCDALAGEIPGGRAIEGMLRRCSDELAERGLEYSPQYLGELRAVGLKFPSSARAGELTPRIALSAGTPRMLEKARAYAEEEGKPLSRRLVAHVRRTALRASATKQLPAKDRSRRAAELPVSELRHHANIGKLETAALEAARRGRDFVGAAAGLEIDQTSRDVLLDDIDRVLETWKIARSAISGRGVAAEAEAFLRTI
jgi:hypothetical protein